jgi:hypothetical protein
MQQKEVDYYEDLTGFAIVSGQKINNSKKL